MIDSIVNNTTWMALVHKNSGPLGTSNSLQKFSSYLLMICLLFTTAFAILEYSCSLVILAIKKCYRHLLKAFNNKTCFNINLDSSADQAYTNHFTNQLFTTMNSAPQMMHTNSANNDPVQIFKNEMRYIFL